jgi:lipopolysaccharide assembly protein A
MQILRTIVWVVLLIVLLLFSINNWTTTEVKIWEGLILETKLPALVIIAFLLGLVPMWLIHIAARWRMTRRIAALETSVRAATPVAAPGPTTPLPTAPADSHLDSERPPAAPPPIP